MMEPRHRLPRGYHVATLAGFSIRIDPSWFVILFLILWSFAGVVFPVRYPDHPTWVYVTMGGAGALLFFASLIAHEFSHAIVARRRGVPVEGITLFMFGGIAHTRSEVSHPGDEFMIAVVGPLTSLFLAGLFAAGARVGVVLGAPGSVTIVAGYLAFLNLLLAIFNLVPGFPLDGGRLLRAGIWKVTGDRARATRWAAGGGKLFGLFLMVLGMLQIVGGMALGGLWMVFIGWFLHGIAGMSSRQESILTLLKGVRAGVLMSAEPETVPSSLSLQALVDDRLMTGRHQSFPVTENGRVVGIVTLNHVRAKARDTWPDTFVSDVMKPVSAVRVGVDEDVVSALDRMGDGGEHRLLVMDGDRLAGILSASDIAAWLQRREELMSLRGA